MTAERVSPRSTLALTLALVLLAGCGQKPRAPDLVTEAVYRNDTIGLTFVVPEGWQLYARANPPAGQKTDHPLLLVAYRSPGSDARSDLELYAADLPDGADLMGYLVRNPIGSEKWTAQGPPQAETIHGAEAARYTLTGSRPQTRREIVTFRRPDRTYLFVITYPASEAAPRDQARHAVESATWK